MLTRIIANWYAWAAETVPPADGLLGYGAVGIFAVIAIGAVWKLFDRQNKLHDQTVARFSEQIAAERARGDRLEARLQTVQQAFLDRAVPAFEASAIANREAVQFFSELTRDREIERRLRGAH